MKLRVSVFLIILSTIAVIGIMRLALDKTSVTEAPTSTKDEPKEIKIPVGKKPPKNATSARDTRELKTQAMKNEDELDNNLLIEDAPILSNAEELSKEDLQKINSIVNLSEIDLAREIHLLKQRIEDEDLFGKLEDGLLTGNQGIEAKNVLERFALLGLEGTRRKYMDVEPELKDPIYAYKESLEEIREFLDDF